MARARRERPLPAATVLAYRTTRDASGNLLPPPFTAQQITNYYMGYMGLLVRDVW